jgi:AcrR family transcriptional regulator
MTLPDISFRQQEIIEASGKILITKGIKALTTKNLALEMGFSESAIYRHFDNKQDILVALFDYILADFKLRLNEILALQLSAIEKLNIVFESQCLFFSQNPHFTLAVLADDIYYEGDKVKNALSKIMAYKFGIIQTILENGVKEGSVRKDIEINELQHTIVGSFRLLLHKWRLSNFDFDLQISGKKMMQTLNLLLQKAN